MLKKIFSGNPILSSFLETKSESQSNIIYDSNSRYNYLHVENNNSFYSFLQPEFSEREKKRKYRLQKQTVMR